MKPFEKTISKEFWGYIQGKQYGYYRGNFGIFVAHHSHACLGEKSYIRVDFSIETLVFHHNIHIPTIMDHSSRPELYKWQRITSKSRRAPVSSYIFFPMYLPLKCPFQWFHNIADDTKISSGILKLNNVESRRSI